MNHLVVAAGLWIELSQQHVDESRRTYRYEVFDADYFGLGMCDISSTCKDGTGRKESTRKLTRLVTWGKEIYGIRQAKQGGNANNV